MQPAVQNYGLIRFVPNSELIKQEQAAAQQRVAAQQTPMANNLAGYIRRLWEEAKQAKMAVEREMLQSLRQRKGEYDPDKLAEIRKFGGSEIYMMLTAVKCRAANAWIKDVLMPAGDRPWALDPTPMPDLSPDVEGMLEQRMLAELAARGIDPAMIDMESKLKLVKEEVEKRIKTMADKAAERMATKIEDQLAEGLWTDAFDPVIDDIVTFKAGIIKNLVFRNRKTLGWVQDPATGRWAPKVESKIVAEFERRSPFDIYPSPTSTTIDDGYLFDRYAFTRGDIYDLIGVEGYDEAEIRAVLDEYGKGGLRQWLWNDQERATLEGRPYMQTASDGTIEALNFWGSVQGKLLLEWGLPAEEIADELAEYNIEAWLIGAHLIKVTINDDPLGRKPYKKASYENIPGSFWGRGVPELMRDIQNLCNAAARALANNMGIASGPQVEVHKDRLAAGESATDVYPWRVWQTISDETGTGRQAVYFHQPSLNAEQLLAVYNQFERRADDATGIPAYSYGNDSTGGAGRTASGLSMLFSAASKGIKQVIMNIDNGIIRPVILDQYNHNMQYDPDESIKGDLRVIARGAAALIIKEQMQIRRTEFMRETNNPTDMAIMGPKGRAVLLRETVKSLDLPPDEVVPPPEAFAVPQGAPMPQGGAMPPGAGPAALNAAGEPAGGGGAALFQQ